ASCRQIEALPTDPAQCPARSSRESVSQSRLQEALRCRRGRNALYARNVLSGEAEAEGNLETSAIPSVSPGAQPRKKRRDHLCASTMASISARRTPAGALTSANLARAAAACWTVTGGALLPHSLRR